MNATSNPQAAAEQASKNYRDVTAQLGLLGLDTSVPEGVRATADKSVAQTHEFYDRSRDALDASLSTLERTFDAAGQGAADPKRTL
jgi:hypothetical protein